MKRTAFFYSLSGYLLMHPIISSAAEPAADSNYTPPPPVIGIGHVVQITVSLLLVLLVIILVAWLLKRMNLGQSGASGLMRVLGSAAIGQRERIVLVEVKDSCVLIGVGPGQIRTLHTFDTPENLDELLNASKPGIPQAKFAQLLNSVISKKKEPGAP